MNPYERQHTWLANTTIGYRMGFYHDASHSKRNPPSPARYCSRCHCRLRSENKAKLCAPCTTARLAEPRPIPPPNTRLCACGRITISKGHRRCQRCTWAQRKDAA